MQNSRTAQEVSKRVGIWIRVSTEDQAQGDSPQHHEQRARYYAEAKGWQVIEVYHLEGVSGKGVGNHPETKRMREDISKGHITGLIFSKLARLARNTKDLLDFADYFKLHDADLISLQESIDTSTPAGRLFYTMIAAMAQWEREEIAERVAASIPIRAKLGKPLGGPSPFGYTWENGKLTLNPQEAPIRRLVFELFAEHGRKKTVASLLNEAGYRTRAGEEFTDTTVTRLLRDPVAKGLRRANYSKRPSGANGWGLKPESDWVFSEVEAIVPEELWEQCNAVLDARRRPNGKKPGKRPVHLFAGLVVCHCGPKMYVPTGTPKYVCKACRNKIPIVDLEGIYQEQLRAFLLSTDELARYVSDAETSIANNEQLLAALTAEHRKVSQDMERLFDLHRTGQIPTQGFGDRYRPLQERLDQIDQEMPRLQADADFVRINFLSGDQVFHEAQTLAERWPHLTLPERRQIVEAITEEIIVGQGDVTINLCYLPVPPELLAKRQQVLTD